ncbi:hypothetical protein [Streptomyces sp. AC550_RSS872]|uniref:hypothetical protein n=1 Tax=Streptomyces sp. AC550_RSS872 TaxID=2823689 RepID=UPI0027E4F627|nr:hypothetical protein [Streptomyces sp. AC550_RSS872]
MPRAAPRTRELRLHLSRRGRTFLTELRARREAALQSALEQMPVTWRTTPMEGLEAF